MSASRSGSVLFVICLLLASLSVNAAKVSHQGSEIEPPIDASTLIDEVGTKLTVADVLAKGGTIPSGPTPPPCSVAKRGRLFLTTIGVGSADIISVCKKKADETYAWTPLSIGTSGPTLLSTDIAAVGAWFVQNTRNEWCGYCHCGCDGPPTVRYIGAVEIDGPSACCHNYVPGCGWVGGSIILDGIGRYDPRGIISVNRYGQCCSGTCDVLGNDIMTSIDYDSHGNALFSIGCVAPWVADYSSSVQLVGGGCPVVMGTGTCYKVVCKAP